MEIIASININQSCCFRSNATNSFALNYKSLKVTTEDVCVRNAERQMHKIKWKCILVSIDMGYVIILNEYFFINIISDVIVLNDCCRVKKLCTYLEFLFFSVLSCTGIWKFYLWVLLSLAQIDKLNVASNFSISLKREWRSVKRGKYVNVIIPSFIRSHCSNSNEIIYQLPVRKASQRKQFDREFHFLCYRAHSIELK
jgi:hypothetical protein